MANQRHIGTTATSIMVTNGRITVAYHQTIVVERVNGIITLDSGGWRTATTKTRMNQASNQYGLGFHVWQRDHKWYVTTATDPHSGIDTPFYDGMQIGPDGLIMQPKS